MKEELVEKIEKRFSPSFGKIPYLACDDGWFSILWNLFSIIETILIKKGIPTRFFGVGQIKEKFGGLRFYWGWDEDDSEEFAKHSDNIYSTYDEIENLVDAAEKESYQTCEITGKAGKTRKDIGWIQTLCEEEYRIALSKMIGNKPK